MKIAYYSNVLGLRDIPELPIFSDEFNQSLVSLLAEFQSQGATMTICKTDGEVIEWRDYQNGVMVNQETTVICYDTVPHLSAISA